MNRPSWGPGQMNLMVVEFEKSILVAYVSVEGVRTKEDFWTNHRPGQDMTDQIAVENKPFIDYTYKCNILYTVYVHIYIIYNIYIYTHS